MLLLRRLRLKTPPLPQNLSLTGAELVLATDDWKKTADDAEVVEEEKEVATGL